MTVPARRGARLASLACALVACALLGSGVLGSGVLGSGVLGLPSARADLRGPRDVSRAVAALSSEDPERRARAASWLALHGPDELVAPPLLASLEREQAPVALSPIATALARRARPEDAPRLLELEPRLRAPARALVTLALAQLGTPESDAWLVTRLAEPPGGELRAAYAEVVELARARREALLPGVLERLAQAPTPLLVEWAASLADERLRATFLVLSAGELALPALDGLAALGPDPETAARVREQLAQPASATRAPGRTLALARALASADPHAVELEALAATGEPAVRAAVLDALVLRAPARAVALLGEDPAALAEADRHVLAQAVEHPSAPLAPWLRALAEDAQRDEVEREAALDALVRLPSCDAPWLEALDGVAIPSADLARARLARACGARLARRGDDPASLHLRAIAGEDVRGAVRARWAGASTDERLALAHAWLVGERDDAVAEALSAEGDPEVFAVLAAAASRWGVRAEGASLRARLEDPTTRLAALSLVPAALDPRVADPRTTRELRRALGARSPEIVAAALSALSRIARPEESGDAHACAALEREERVLRGAALAVLGASAPCVRGRARVDPALRALLASSASEEGLALRVVSNVGGPLPRVEIVADDGRLLVLRPPPSGLLYVPGIGRAHVSVRLETTAER